MSDERLHRIIQEEIEGTATPQELDQLHAAVATDPGLRAERDALRALSGDLDRLPLVEPPTWLAEHTTRAIAARNASSATAAKSQATAHAVAGKASGEGSWTGLLREWFRPRPVLAFAGGLAAAVAILFGVSPETLTGRTDGMAGTMAPIRGGSVVDRIEISDNGFQGTLEVIRAGDQVVLDLDLKAPSNVEYRLRNNPEGLLLVGFLESNPGHATSVTLSPESVVGSGTDQYRIIWEAGTHSSPDLHLELRAGDSTFSSRRLRIGS